MKLILTSFLLTFLLSSYKGTLYPTARRIRFEVKSAKVVISLPDDKWRTFTHLFQDDSRPIIDVGFSGLYVDDGPNKRSETNTGKTQDSFTVTDPDNPDREFIIKEDGLIDYQINNEIVINKGNQVYAHMIFGTEVIYSSYGEGWTMELQFQRIKVLAQADVFKIDSDGTVSDSDSQIISSDDDGDGDGDRDEDDVSDSYDQDVVRKFPKVKNEVPPLLFPRNSDSKDDDGDDDLSETETKHKKTARKLLTTVLNNMNNYFKKLSFAKV
jgi:hypothetical protein